MNQEQQIIFEILNLVSSFLTPIFILVLGIRINKNLEKNKKNLLQEKEWQTRWAETFLQKAIEYEENISVIVSNLSMLDSIYRDKSTESKNKQEILLKKTNESFAKVKYLTWDIQNFAQFASENCSDFINKQSELNKSVRDIFAENQRDLDIIKEIQIEYNELVRKVHYEILHSKYKNVQKMPHNN